MIVNVPSVLAAIALLAAGVAAVLLMERFERKRWLPHVSIGALLLALLSLFILPRGLDSGLLRVDLYSVFFGVIFLAIALFTAMSAKSGSGAYHASLLLSAIGMLLAASANDLLLLYVSIELVTAPTYVLVAFGKTRQRMEAAMKYFVIGIVSSVLLLLGLLLLATAAGTTALDAFVAVPSPLFLLGVAALLGGLAFKLGIFPFNFWIPDVYQGAPAEVAGLLAGASKKAAFAAFIRVAAVVLAAVHSWTLLIAVLAALTMTVPNLVALWQSNARRLVAYSIMTHAGFLLMGVALGTAAGLGATLFHAFTHAFMAMGALLVLGVFLAHRLETIDELNGLGFRSPLLAASLTVFLLSLAGIPLLSGFASKLYLFYAAAQGGLVWLAVLAVLNSVIALYYYFRIIRAMYGYRSAGRRFEVRTGVLVAVVLCLFVTVLFGIYPQPVIEIALAAAQGLL